MADTSPAARPEQNTNVVDPACGIAVDNRTVSVLYRDREYHFCSIECRTAFERNPEAYVGRARRAPEPIRRSGVRAGLGLLLVMLVLVVVLPAMLGLILRGWVLAFRLAVGAMLIALAAIVARMARQNPA